MPVANTEQYNFYTNWLLQEHVTVRLRVGVVHFVTHVPKVSGGLHVSHVHLVSTETAMYKTVSAQFLQTSTVLPVTKLVGMMVFLY